ncbi:MAG TPA: methionyl-tRNA formyltransferase [Candidatus Binatia bacterium]|jgi:methionyl-tRNA formyltransferase
MGTPEYAAVSLRRLLESPHRVRAVVTRPDKPRGRGRNIEPGPVRRVAEEAGIEVLAPASARDETFLQRLHSLRADLGVVVAYGRILPAAALAAPRLGCINAHASLLPELRGAAPIERSILAGLTRTGVTIMQMNEGLDEGDILFASEVAILDETTGGSLREQLAGLSAQMLVEAVDRVASGSVHPVAQDNARATFAPPLRREETAIRWGEDAHALWLRVRAFAPRPGAFALDGRARLKILEARVAAPAATPAAPGTIIAQSGAAIVVACGTGALALHTVQPEGKRAMAARDWALGLRDRGDPPHVLHDGI